MINMTSRLRQQEGFTLIELMIVIVVLGILAGIALFGVGTFRQDAKNSCSSSNAKILKTAQAAYEAKTGTPGASQATLVSLGYMEAPGSC